MTPGKLPTFFDFELIILNPPAPSSGLSTAQVGPGGTITASGTLSYNVGKSLQTIWGSLGYGPPQPGTIGSNGRDWTIPGIGGAVVGGQNVLTVGGTYDDGSTVTPCTRTFTGIGGSSGSSGSGTFDGRPVLAAGQILPRFYRVVLDGKSLNLFESGSEMLLGGLLQRTPVYLAYDPVQSTLEAPVWRDVNLPLPAGGWALRVASCGSRTTARLVLTRLSDVHVLPPLVWLSDDWSLQQPNVMYGAETPPTGSAMHLWVEPA